MIPKRCFASSYEDQQGFQLQGQESNQIGTRMDQSEVVDHGDFIYHFNSNLKAITDVKLNTIWDYWWLGDSSKKIIRFTQLTGEAFSIRSTPTKNSLMALSNKKF